MAKSKNNRVRVRLQPHQIKELKELRGKDFKEAVNNRYRMTKDELEKVGARHKVEPHNIKPWVRRVREIIKDNNDISTIGIKNILREEGYNFGSNGAVASKVHNMRKALGLQDKEKPKTYVPGLPITPQRFNKIPVNDGEKSGVYVITGCVNDTPVHEGFYNSLRHYCRKREAELIVFANKYRNPTSPFEHDRNAPKWDDRVLPFLVRRNVDLHEYLTMIKANAIPTRAYPLNGLENHTGPASVIVPHPKQHFRSIPVYKNDVKKLAISTGVISIPNYSESDIGMKGEFHHTIGAAVVEIDGDHFHVRHISAQEDGSFYDISDDGITLYTAGGAIKPKKEGVDFVWGDIHFGHHDQNCVDEAVNVASKLNTREIVIHDIMDSYAAAKHDYKNPFEMFKRVGRNFSSVKKEVEDLAFDFLSPISNALPRTNFKVTRANHDEHLDQWLCYQKPSTLTPENVPYWHYLNWRKYDSFDGKNFGNILEIALSDHLDLNKLRFKFFTTESSFRIRGIEVAGHGHIGANGSRGSTKGFSKLSTKTIHGHVHSPSIVGGATSVGVFCNHPDYAKGPSGWIKNMAIIYPNGKRTLLNYINGKFYR